MSSIDSSSGPATRRAGAPADNPKNMVNSVVKAFAVLQAFQPTASVLTVTEVAAAANLDRGTAYRMLTTLRSLGYLHAVPSKRFRLSLKCLELGFVALTSQDLWEHAMPLLQDCVPGVADAASLGTLEGSDIIYLQRADNGFVRHNVDIRPGRRVQAYGAALGHAILAFLPESTQIQVLEGSERRKLSESTLTELPDLLERLVQVQERGFAISDGENAYGLRTVAAPIFSSARVPIAAVSLTVDAARMTIDQLVERAAPRALSIAEELTRAMADSVDTIPLSITL
jgi:IclR family transcriptional regulator, pca regulon regulatory protein